jgi:hypothetical protein
LAERHKRVEEMLRGDQPWLSIKKEVELQLMAEITLHATLAAEK